MNLLYLIKNVILGSHPVGTIYMTLDPIFNPQNKWGVWEKIEGRMLIGADSTYPLASTGGEATHTHTLNDGYAKIVHTYASSINATFVKTKSVNWTPERRTENNDRYVTYSSQLSQATELGGNTDAHNNLPPYLAVNIWKRTA